MSDISTTTGAQATQTTQTTQTVVQESKTHHKSPFERMFALLMQRADLLTSQLEEKGDQYEQQLQDLKDGQDAIKEMQEAQKNGSHELSKKTEDWMRRVGCPINGTNVDGRFQNIGSEEWQKNIDTAQSKVKSLTSDNTKFDTEYKDLATKLSDVLGFGASYGKQNATTMRQLMPSS